MGLVIEGGHAWLPPVLGAQPTLPRGGNMCSLVQVPQRLGAETVIIPREPSVLAGLDALMVLNPEIEYGDTVSDSPWCRGVRTWVEGGGRLFVVVRSEHYSHPHDRSGAYTDGISLLDMDSPDPDIRIKTASVGAGRITLLVGSENLDSTALGHCMGYPHALERRRLSAVYFALEDLGAMKEGDRRTYIP